MTTTDQNAPTELALEREGGNLAALLPALLTDAEHIAQAATLGAHGRRRPGPGETFWQYRDYTIGDAASLIDWRQSARSPSRLYVRETEWESAATVRAFCGGGEGFYYASSAELPTKAWRAQTLAVGLSLLLTRAGERVGLLRQDEAPPASSGSAAVVSLAEMLLEEAPHTALPVPPGGTSDAVYFSDLLYPTDEVVRMLDTIASTGIPTTIVCVADPAEATFPFSGHRRFTSPGGETSLRFGDTRAIQQAYLDRRAAHRGAIDDACRHHGITLLHHETDQPATPVLAQLHSALSGEGPV